jgi:hypothetical protein
MSVVSVVCCQVEVSATGSSLVQRIPTECGVSKSVIVKPRKMRWHRPPRGCRAIGGKNPASGPYVETKSAQTLALYFFYVYLNTCVTSLS